MINEFDRIIAEGKQNKDVRAFGKAVGYLTEKFGVSEKTLYNRFKSTYGKSPKDVIKDAMFPTTEEFIQVVLNSTSSEQVRGKLGLSNRSFVGIYDKYLQVSTFHAARLHLLNARVNVKYTNLREDNRSLIYSQLLGDGSYDARRHALRIIHGEKQVGYLKWKVSMINHAYPKTATKVTVRTHAQGHVYGDYYTALGNVDVFPEHECVEKLTNLGWLLWWLDDGSHTQNITIACKRSELVRQEAVRVLATYGIQARADGVNIIIAGQENDLKFYYNFIHPFIAQIPECMMYKVEDIVEMARI